MGGRVSDWHAECVQLCRSSVRVLRRSWDCFFKQCSRRSRRSKRMGGWVWKSLVLRRRRGRLDRQLRTDERPMEVQPCDRAVDLDGRKQRCLAGSHVWHRRNAGSRKHPGRTQQCSNMEGQRRKFLDLRRLGHSRASGGRIDNLERPLAISTVDRYRKHAEGVWTISRRSGRLLIRLNDPSCRAWFRGSARRWVPWGFRRRGVRRP